jgi:hypothetical protein
MKISNFKLLKTINHLVFYENIFDYVTYLFQTIGLIYINNDQFITLYPKKIEF